MEIVSIDVYPIFFSGNTEYYEEIKYFIIEWIENNYEDYLDFFGDDDANNLPREYFAKKELDYIKSKNSWGSHYTIAISFLLYNLDIALYVKENQNTFKRLNFLAGIINRGVNYAFWLTIIIIILT